MSKHLISSIANFYKKIFIKSKYLARILNFLETNKIILTF